MLIIVPTSTSCCCNNTTLKAWEFFQAIFPMWRCGSPLQRLIDSRGNEGVGERLKRIQEGGVWRRKVNRGRETWQKTFCRAGTHGAEWRLKRKGGWEVRGRWLGCCWTKLSLRARVLLHSHCLGYGEGGVSWYSPQLPSVGSGGWEAHHSLVRETDCRHRQLRPADECYRVEIGGDGRDFLASCGSEL